MGKRHTPIECHDDATKTTPFSTICLSDGLRSVSFSIWQDGNLWGGYPGHYLLSFVYLTVHLNIISIHLHTKYSQSVTLSFRRSTNSLVVVSNLRVAGVVQSAVESCLQGSNTKRSRLHGASWSTRSTAVLLVLATGTTTTSSISPVLSHRINYCNSAVYVSTTIRIRSPPATEYIVGTPVARNYIQHFKKEEALSFIVKRSKSRVGFAMILPIVVRLVVQ